MGIPFSYWITLAVWVRVRVTGDVHITRYRVLEMGCPKCGDAHAYQCDSGTTVEFEEWRTMARTMFSDPGPRDTFSATPTWIPTNEKLECNIDCNNYCNNKPNLVLRVLLFFSMTVVRFLILAN